MAEVIYNFVGTTRGSLAFGFTRTLETLLLYRLLAFYISNRNYVTTFFISGG